MEALLRAHADVTHVWVGLVTHVFSLGRSCNLTAFPDFFLSFFLSYRFFFFLFIFPCADFWELLGGLFLLPEKALAANSSSSLVSCTRIILSLPP